MRCPASHVPAFASPTPQSSSPVSATQLQALSGEYTDPNEPGNALSFYTQNGKLVLESDRQVPTELKPLSATEFSLPESKIHRQFHARCLRPRRYLVVFSNQPDVVYRRTGEPVHHVFHDYQRSEVMIPMRDGVKLHAVILKPADIPAPLPFLMQRTPYGVDGTTPRLLLRQPA